MFRGHEFDRLVEAHGADARVRRLTTKSQLVALLYGQLSGAASLREIVTGLASHAVRLYHVGAEPVRRSTLSDANAQRPGAVFADLLAAMMKQAHRGLRRKLAETTYLIDATGVRLNELSAGWARFSAGVCGAKLHVIYDPDADRPIYAAVTAANVNDITVAKADADRAGRHLRLRSRLLRLCLVGQARRRRLPDRHPLQIQHAARRGRRAAGRRGRRHPLRPHRLPARRQASSRCNPFQDPVREVRVKTDTGKVLRILSNDLDATAQEIADLYKRRWAIELFFRWVKQTLKIPRFLGTSENAVRIQIAVALIAFLLLRLAQAAQNTFKARSPSPDWSAPTSCTAGESIICSQPRPRLHKISAR